MRECITIFIGGMMTDLTEHKVCPKCKRDLPLADFCVGRGKLGYSCRKCSKQMDRDYQESLRQAYIKDLSRLDGVPFSIRVPSGYSDPRIESDPSVRSSRWLQRNEPIIRMRYSRNMVLGDIADREGVSRQAVYQRLRIFTKWVEDYYEKSLQSPRFPVTVEFPAPLGPRPLKAGWLQKHEGILRMRFRDGLSYEAISKEAGIPAGTVWSLLQGFFKYLKEASKAVN